MPHNPEGKGGGQAYSLCAVRPVPALPKFGPDKFNIHPDLRKWDRPKMKYGCEIVELSWVCSS